MQAAQRGERLASGDTAVPWLVVPLALLAVAVVARAWLADDAFLTLRSVQNALHGWGLRYNAAERVQVYTHPLWMLALLAAIGLTGEVVRTTVALGLGLTLAAAGLLARGVARDPRSGGLAVLALLGSRAALDYGTSGLENPLATLLVVALVWRALGPAGEPGGVGALAGVGGLLFLTRFDLGLLAAPAVLAAWWRAPDRRRAHRALGAGALAPLLWLAFSTGYYGFPFPNTYYAKLGAGIALGTRLSWGGAYLADAAGRDPFTVLVLALGLGWGLLGRAPRGARPLALGGLAYLLYVVWIGGDFMAGRFLTAPFALALGLLAHRGAPASPRGRGMVVALLVVAACGVQLRGSPEPQPGAGLAGDGPRAPQGVTDERAVYLRVSRDLLTGRRPLPPWPRAHPLAAPRRVEVVAAAGLRAYEAGPAVHVVDPYALADPLLARLPAQADRAHRVGHLARNLPRGYLETLRGESGKMADPDLARYLGFLHQVIRGPLDEPGRLEHVLAFLLGWYDPLVHRDLYALPPLPEPARVEVLERLPEPPEAPVPVEDCVEAPLPAAVPAASHLECALSGGITYAIHLFDGPRPVGRVIRDGYTLLEDRLRPEVVRLPPALVGVRVDRVRVQRLAGPGVSSLGSLRVR